MLPTNYPAKKQGELDKFTVCTQSSFGHMPLASFFRFPPIIGAIFIPSIQYGRVGIGGVESEIPDLWHRHPHAARQP